MLKLKQFFRRNGIFLLFVLAIILVLLSNLPKEDNLIDSQDYFKVTRVIDGDTFYIESGDKVRLICIDTPEVGEAGYQEASDYLSGLVLNKTVILVKDVSETDKYGRLLRYVYLEDGTFVNKEIVQNGFGDVFRYGEDVSLCGEIDG